MLPYSDIRRNEPSFTVRCGGPAVMAVVGDAGSAMPVTLAFF